MRDSHSDVAATGFRRARKPEQIAARREAILAAAGELFDAEGPEDAGLNAIAARAGFTKSNVYRYFESREAVLLSLFVEAFEVVVKDLQAGLKATEVGDLAAVARGTTGVFLKHRRFCRLLSILSPVLERNVSEAGIITMKRATKALSDRVAIALHGALPSVSVEDCAWLTSIVMMLVAGLWPSAHPASTAARVLAVPEFAGLKPVAERDLALAILVMFRGISKN